MPRCWTRTRTPGLSGTSTSGPGPDHFSLAFTYALLALEQTYDPVGYVHLERMMGMR